MFTEDEFKKMNSIRKIKVYRCINCGRVQFNMNPNSLCPVCIKAGLKRDLKKLDVAIVCTDCNVPVYVESNAKSFECPICGKTETMSNFRTYASKTHVKLIPPFGFKKVSNWFVEGDYYKSVQMYLIIGARRYLRRLND